MKSAWRGVQKAQAVQKAYDELRAKYTVLLPAPPEAEKRSAAAGGSQKTASQ